jgi:hypothetical protein
LESVAEKLLELQELPEQQELRVLEWLVRTSAPLTPASQAASASPLPVVEQVVETGQPEPVQQDSALAQARLQTSA